MECIKWKKVLHLTNPYLVNHAQFFFPWVGQRVLNFMLASIDSTCATAHSSTEKSKKILPVIVSSLNFPIMHSSHESSALLHYCNGLDIQRYLPRLKRHQHLNFFHKLPTAKQ